MIERMLSLDDVLRPDSKDRFASKDLFSLSSQHPEKQHVFWWRDVEDAGDTCLPSLVLPANGDTLELFADVATYYPSYVPISAYMHVVTPELPGLRELCSDRGFKAAKARYVRPRFNQIWVALAVAEGAATVAENADSSVELSYSVCRRSLSFSLARAAMLYPDLASQSVANKWERLRSLARMPTSSELTTAILDVSALIRDDETCSSSLTEGTDQLVYLLTDLANGQISYEQVILAFRAIYPGIDACLQGFQRSFEQRINAFESAVSLIRSIPRGRYLDGLAMAYFANLLQPGSLAHLKLVSRMHRQFPSALIWYGFFAAVSQGFNIDGNSQGLGRKLMRDVEADFDPFAAPSNDISLDELEALSGTSLKNSVLKPIHQRAMLVGLFPGVDVLVRVPDESAQAVESSRHIEISENSVSPFLEKEDQLRTLVAAMADLLGLAKPPEVQRQAAVGRKPRAAAGKAAKQKKTTT